jgi:signal transduction histidine kinase
MIISPTIARPNSLFVVLDRCFSLTDRALEREAAYESLRLAKRPKWQAAPSRGFSRRWFHELRTPLNAIIGFPN